MRIENISEEDIDLLEEKGGKNKKPDEEYKECFEFNKDPEEWDYVDEWRGPWTPVRHDGKLLVIDFNTVFGRDDIDEDFCKFLIEKTSYVKNLNLVPHYINYFIKFYDTENELMMAYHKLKYLSVKRDLSFTPKAYKKLIYNILFTPSMVEKIKRFVDDNYLLNINSDAKVRKYAENTIFADIHAKILFRCSMAIKLMIPVAFHFLFTHPDKINGKLNPQSHLFDFFKGTFDVFTEDGIDIYIKARCWVDRMVNRDVKSNGGAWARKTINGMDPLIKAISLFEKDFTIDTLYKYVHKKDKNPIKLNDVVIRAQLGYHNRGKDKHTMREVSGKRGGQEGELSSLDKLSMTAAQIDESLIILSQGNINSQIEKFRNQIKFVTDEEIDYYYEHHVISSLQQQLVNYFYAKYFDGFTDLNMLNKREYITLMVLLKRRLEASHYIYLPQIFSGNILGKINNRVIQNINS